MKDVVADIPKMKMATFVTSDPMNFTFVGSISDVMLDWVHVYSDIIKAYREIPNSGIREIIYSLQKALETFDFSKVEEHKNYKILVVRLRKIRQQNPNYKQTIIDEDSDELTQSKDI